MSRESPRSRRLVYTEAGVPNQIMGAFRFEGTDAVRVDYRDYH